MYAPAGRFSASSESITLSRGGEVAFSNLSVNASAYLWNFGDGQTSTQPNPVHVYTAPGNYQVTLVAWQNACADTTSLNIGVSDALLSVGAAFSSDGLFNTSVRQEGGAFWVRMYSPEAQEVSVQIFDPLGRVIGQELSVQPGRTTMQLPMHGQPTGNYMVRISTPSSSKTHKVYLP
ncbi:MAG: PKD domain-containing protein [Bacteroidota bacterium]